MVWDFKHWYTVECSNGTKTTFKWLGIISGTSEMCVEFCDGQIGSFVIPMYKNIIHHGEQSPCSNQL